MHYTEHTHINFVVTISLLSKLLLSHELMTVSFEMKYKIILTLRRFSLQTTILKYANIF